MDNSKFKQQPPDRRIAQALQQRLGELCKTSADRISPDHFGGQSSFATQAQEILQLENISSWMEGPAIDASSPPCWIDSEGDGFLFLRQLALGELPSMGFKDTYPQESAGAFLKMLDENKSEWLRLLIERYQCPLNLRLESEKEIVEFILYQLMVPNRVKLDKGNLDSLDHDELLVMLNFIAVYVSGSTDLRFVDSLNYYYERLPVNWKPEGAHPWLLISFYALYARALTSGV